MKSHLSRYADWKSTHCTRLEDYIASQDYSVDIDALTVINTAFKMDLPMTKVKLYQILYKLGHDAGGRIERWGAPKYDLSAPISEYGLFDCLPYISSYSILIVDSDLQARYVDVPSICLIMRCDCYSEIIDILNKDVINMDDADIIYMLRQYTGASMQLCVNAMEYASTKDGCKWKWALAYLKSGALPLGTGNMTQEQRIRLFYERMLE